MLRVDRIIGDRTDPELRERLHELEHHGTVDIFRVAIADLDRHRLRARTECGEEVTITLPRHEKLFDGAVIHLAETRAIVVRAGEQRWMRISPRTLSDASELGYCAGNLHWRVRFDDGDILVALDGPMASYASRIEHFLRDNRASISEESA